MVVITAASNVCVCVCVCVRERERGVCVCVCVFVQGTESNYHVPFPLFHHSYHAQVSCQPQTSEQIYT